MSIRGIGGKVSSFQNIGKGRGGKEDSERKFFPAEDAQEINKKMNKKGGSRKKIQIHRQNTGGG